jgi:hypothetical protein
VIHERTFNAISKLKEIEIELHRLKNALEMANKALDAKREWVDLDIEEVDSICEKYKDHQPRKLYVEIRNLLKEKNT